MILTSHSLVDNDSLVRTSSDVLHFVLVQFLVGVSLDLDYLRIFVCPLQWGHYDL